MRHIFILAVRAKVPDKQTRGILALGDATVGPTFSVLRFNQIFVGPCGICIAHHNIRRNELAVGQFNPDSCAIFNTYTRHRGVVANGDVAGLYQIYQGFHDGACATHGGMHTPAVFQNMDQRINTGDRKRIATDQQGVKTHHDTQLRVLDVLRHHAVNGAPSFHANQVWHGFDHFGDRVKSDHAHLLETQFKALLRRLHEVLKTLHILWAELGNFCQHGLLVIAVIEMGAVVEADAVERRHQTQVDMVLHLFAAQREQLFNQIGQCDDGGACIKGKAVLFVHIGATTRHVQFFKNLNLVALDA